jgi:predicted phosphate transport protein (TIGR00153 family)
LDLAQEQIARTIDTVTLLNHTMQSISEGKRKDAAQYIQNLFKAEEDVDRLRTEVFKELSKGAALIADYREDLLHLVKRLDTLADHVKDAARCLQMLGDAQIPEEFCKNTVCMTSMLVDCAHALRVSIEKISVSPHEAIQGAEKVEEIEHELDNYYIKTKSSFVKHSDLSAGFMVIFDDLIEFIEHAADMCADTADYIVVLSSRE